jgi:predicted nuclease with TOPRIM domain
MSDNESTETIETNAELMKQIKEIKKENTDLKFKFSKIIGEIEKMKKQMEENEKELLEFKEKFESEKEKNENKTENKTENKASQYVKEDNSNIVDIIIKQYKKSILVISAKDTHTTYKCKDELKEIGAKWTNIENVKCWIFTGKMSNEDTLEENSKFIIEKLEKSFDVKYKITN